MARLTMAVLLLGVSSCASLEMIDVPSQNHNSRINFLVLHFTSENFAESLRLLTQHTDNRVSVHYLVPEPGDETYGRRTLGIHRLVTEERRAWHAGQSYWAEADALNDTSIGIEIVNQSACVDDDPETDMPTPERQTCSFLAYPEEQIALVMRLASDILARNPDIDPVDVIGHGDIATDRRVDPGPLFPWERLYKHGIGAWYDDETVARYTDHFEGNMPEVWQVQFALRAYGYLVEETGENDIQTRFAVRAFQMHFRPSEVSAEIDLETVAILFALIEKYRAESLATLPQYSGNASSLSANEL